MTFVSRLAVSLIVIGLALIVPASAQSEAPASAAGPPASVATESDPVSAAFVLYSICPSIASMTSADGSDYAVTFQSARPIFATIALRLYAIDHDYLVTLPSVSFPIGRTAGGTSLHESQPVHLRKPPGPAIFAASVYSTLLTPESSLCDVKNSDVEVALSPTIARHDAPGSGAIAAAVDLTPVLPTGFTCSNPFAGPEVARAAQVHYPRFTDAAGIVDVQVTLDAAGSVTGAKVARSSGDGALDDAGLQAAKTSSFTPALVDCKPHKSIYYFRADFLRDR